MSQSRSNRRFRVAILLAGLLAACAVAAALAFAARPGLSDGADRFLRLRAWLADPAGHTRWAVSAGQRCQPGAPMLIPTSGYIGFGWSDSFRPGHSHSGYDIFSPDGENNITPVVAAYEGYLTRETDWRSAVIIRHPDFPAVVPGEQIWTYYTHMASADGETSYISARFPPGTHEVFVEAGTLLGYQGNWSGNPVAPTGLHLHFSVVKSAIAGGYANETEIANTYDPGPFLGVIRNQEGVLTCGHPS